MAGLKICIHCGTFSLPVPKREREGLFSTIQQNICRTKWQQQNKVEGCRKGTRPILAGHPLQKNIITIINNAVQGAKCVRHKCAQFSDTTSYSVNKNTLRLCLKREVDWIVFRLSGKLFHIRVLLYFNDFFPNVVHGVDIWKSHLSLVSCWWISLFWVK